MSGGAQGSGGQVPAPSAGGDPSMEDILASIRRILSEDETPEPLPAAAAPPFAAAPAAAAPAAVAPAAGAPSASAPSASAPAAEDVFALDESMLVQEPVIPPQDRAGASPLVALGSFMTAPTQPDIVPVKTAPPPLPPAPPPPAPPAPEIAMATESFPAPGFKEAKPAADHLVDRHAEYLASTAPLVGPEASAAATASMGTLLRTLNAEKQPAPAPTFVYRGGPTLEDMVRDEMRPMLKQWLDANLPEMVERLVRAEIERVAGRAVV